MNGFCRALKEYRLPVEDTREDIAPMNDLPEPEVVARRPKNKRITILVMVALAVIIPVTTFFWMYPAWETSQAFEEPKITIAHLDGEPFMRVQLGPDQSYRPIELMAGTRVNMECEVVTVQEKRRFAFQAFGRDAIRDPDCNYMVDIPGEVGLAGKVVFTYFDGDAEQPTDVMEIPVVVVGDGERMEFHGLEDGQGRSIQAASVPDRVVVYARAILNDIPDYRKLVPLFFVAESVSGVPVLQLNPSREDDEEPAPLTGQLVRYRHYGEKMRGYALWSRDTLSVGGPSDHRKVFDIYYGFFPKKDLDEVFKKTLSVEWTGEDAVKVKPLITDIEDLRALTWQGRSLSPPLHVVRGPGEVDTGGSISPEQQ